MINLPYVILTRFNIFFHHRFIDTSFFDHFAVEFAAFFDRPFLSFVIAVHEAETGGFSFFPFEVVDKAPMIIGFKGEGRFAYKF